MGDSGSCVPVVAPAPVKLPRSPQEGREARLVFEGWRGRQGYADTLPDRTCHSCTPLTAPCVAGAVAKSLPSRLWVECAGSIMSGVHVGFVFRCAVDTALRLSAQTAIMLKWWDVQLGQ